MKEGGRKEKKMHQTHRRKCISETNTENHETLIDAIYVVLLYVEY